jgi:hypothetical protein
VRYYSIVISGAPAAFPSIPGASVAGAQWDSWVHGQNDPGAQQVEFQIEEYRPNLPTENSTLTIYGVSFDQIKQSANLVGKPIAIYGGMKPGLPIATVQSAHAGLLMQGQIIKCWGNWIGTEMSLGMSFAPAGYTSAQSSGGGGGGGGAGGGGGGGAGAGQSAQIIRFGRTGPRSLLRRSLPRGLVRISPADTTGSSTSPGATGTPSIPAFSLGTVAQLGPSAFGAATTNVGGVISSLFGGGGNGLQAPINLIHNLLPNMPLSGAIQQTLSTAFPSAGTSISISSLLKLAYQDAGVYQNLEQYSKYLNKLAGSILGIKNYIGVQFSSYNNTIHVWDGTTPITQGQISVVDLIGQPTWIEFNKINIKTVLRADIHCGSYVTLPPTLTGLTEGAIIAGAPEQKTVTSFNGVFVVWRVLYIGDFRNPDGAGWSANYEAILRDATTGMNATEANALAAQLNQVPSAGVGVVGL